MKPTTGVGHQVAHRPPRRTRWRTAGRGDADLAASRRSRPAPRRRAARAPPRPRPAPSPAARATPSRASSSTRSGSRQLSRPAATSAPIRKTSSSSGRCSLKQLQGPDTCRTAPRARPRASEASSAGRCRPPRAASSPAARSAPGSGSIRLCGASPAGTSSTSSSPSCGRRLLGEHQVPDVRRVEGAPEDADRGDRSSSGAYSARTWPSPWTTYLNVVSSRSADRPARVQLLGRVADLGAHPELEAVGEPGRGVDVDAPPRRPRR